MFRQILKRVIKPIKTKIFKTFISLELKDYLHNKEHLISLIPSTQTAFFIMENMNECPSFLNKYHLLKYSLRNAIPGGLLLEFGVFEGKSINYISSIAPKEIVYGFDSFEGLPEYWRKGFPKGLFKLNELPPVKSNVKLIVGLFKDKLDYFLDNHPKHISFIHMDADLYSSTKYVLCTLAKYDRLRVGTVIQFDEFYNYPNWRIMGEYRAFNDFINEYNVEYEYLGYTICPKGGEVSIKITHIPRANSEKG